MPTADLNGVELYYETAGTGDLLVLTHGSWTDGGMGTCRGDPRRALHGGDLGPPGTDTPAAIPVRDRAAGPRTPRTWRR